MAGVTFEGVGKVYPDGTRAVEGLDLEIGDGEFVVLVGPSGCGKTTALRMVAGLEEISEGAIRIGGQVVNDADPGDRDIAMVFQNYALYPHMSVRDNIGFGLRMRKMARPDRNARVERIARVLGLAELLERKPRQLSGGQRQRVAMGRAIVREPKAFLMDEPLSNLDARLRVEMRAEIARIQREVRATTIYVTHDQIEAMTMGDRVVVMRKGRLQQVDDPQVLFDAPVNLFVASFIGSPQMNLLQATVEREGDRLALALGDQRITLPEEVTAGRPALASYAGQTVAVGIRPEYTAAPTDGDEVRLAGTLLLSEPLGAESLVHVELPVSPVSTEEVLEVARDADPAFAQELHAAAATARSTFLARFAGSQRGRSGERVAVAVDPRKLYLFDLEHGDAIGAGPEAAKVAA
jgi:multiple sugar transport system ATP-binding protein